MARVSVFTLINRSVKNMGDVNSKVKALAVELIIRSYHAGINIQITSGYRSNAEQTRLYNQGRSTPGNIVTNAKAGQSIHNYGLAIDYVLVSEDGNKAYWDISRNMNGNQVRDWFEVAAIGKELGFQWGGDWTSFRDYPHLDMQRGVSLSRLAAGKRPSIPSVPDRGYFGVGDTGAGIKDIQYDLNKAGYSCTADGDFGEGTESAVKRFQKANGLVVDGYFGKSSEAKLRAILANLKAATPKPVQKPKEEDKVAESKNNKPSEWAKEYVEEAVKIGLSDGSRPQEPLTREEGIVLVMRGLGLAPKLK